MVIGGNQDGQPSYKTFIYFMLYNLWDEGPELKVPRSGASCGVLGDSNHIVMAGGYNDDGLLSSSEVIIRFHVDFLDS